MAVIHENSEIITRVIQLAADQSGLEAAEVTADMRLVEDLEFDSLDIVEFTMTIEDEFDLSISDEDAEKVRTVGHAIELVAAALSQAARP